mgnify:CR=1 FL=1
MSHYYQAIVTKFAGPIGTRGARVQASAQAGKASYPWRHELSTQDNHRDAAQREGVLCSVWSTEYSGVGRVLIYSESRFC